MKSLFRKTLGLVLSCVLLLPSMEAFAQQQITGKVVDTGGVPVIGASVVVEGTANGVITDAEGVFSIKAPAGSPIVVSSLGYVDAKANLQNGLVIVLAEDAEMLDETVVVGYGYQKKETLTGAIAAIKSDEIVSTKSENMANMLSGKVAGFRVLQRTSEPGAQNTTFDIRGMGTPLIIIDGVPATSTDFARLNGNEIENISILKDAAASVYGVRAANGVVLVTTKEGKAGKVQFSYDATLSVQTPTMEPDLMEAAEYMTIYNEYVRNTALGTGTVNPYSDETIKSYQDGTNKSYDWYGLAMNKYAPMQQHNLSARGGTDKVKYFMSVGYLSQEGLPKSGIMNYQRWNLRSNVSAEVAKGLTVSLNLSGLKDDKNSLSVSIGDVYKSMWRQIPTNNPYVNDDPSMPYAGYDSQHPAVMLDENLSGYNRTSIGKISGTGSIAWDIPWVKGLTAKALFSYAHQYTEGRTFNKQVTLYNPDGSTVKTTATTMNRNYTPLDNTTSQVSLNYARKFGDHDVKALALFEQVVQKSDNFWVARSFTLDVLDELFAGNSDGITGNTTASQVYTNVNNGFVSRLNYGYKDKYLLEASLRVDSSSKFMAGHRTGVFPSVSAGWRVTQEDFIRNSSLSNVLTNLKLRASWGRMGDDSASTFQWLAGYSYPATSNNVWDRNYVSGSATTGVPNYAITWYTADMLDLGFDMDLWHGLFGVTFDWYRRDRDGLLATKAVSVPGVFGASFAQENLNSDMTTGLEIVISSRKQIGDFRYEVSANFGSSRTMNKYVERSASTDTRNNWLNNTNNRWDSRLWGYDYLGQFSSYEEAWGWASYQGLYSASYGNQYVLPGDIKLGDWNEDGVIDGNDTHVIAYTNDKPLYNYGLNSNFAYKGFDLNVLFQGAWGSTYQLGEKFYYALPWLGASNGLSMFLDRWHTADNTDNPYDPNTQWIAGSFPSNRLSDASPNYSSTNLWSWKKIWYLRLKSVELGYTLPEKWLQHVHIQKLRVFANGFNLFTFTNQKYMDPERPSTSYGYGYPLAKTYSFGVNLTF